MNDLTWIFGFLFNLIGVFFIVIQTRVSLERRISVLETYMKILLREKGVAVRKSDNLEHIREEDLDRYER